MTAKRVNLLATTTNKPPVLQRSQKGDPYTTFTVVTSDRTKDRTGQWIDGPTQFYRCTAFGTTAENIVNTCAQPTELVISGRETTEEWASDQGPRTSVKITIDQVGVSLRRQYANVHKAHRNDTSPQQTAQPANDPWNSAPTPPSSDDNPPF